MDQTTGEIAESLHLITSLQSQLESLQIRVKELESDNAKLSSLVSNCCCHKAEENILARVSGSFGLVDERGSSNSNGGKSRKKMENQTVPDDKVRTEHQYSKRYVALKVMYFGQRFFGFASEAQMDPTVECWKGPCCKSSAGLHNSKRWSQTFPAKKQILYSCQTCVSGILLQAAVRRGRHSEQVFVLPKP
ncbi:hypothetical protein RHMOL_Rhmol06G0130500 [Rhododendron molle]|uniref:Uncharacterized protein n=1 Tax=Rhododendron molle TaxID=49168 RepID=A0ACC0NCV6_RHOML|nr:hypothetical protein RHMOL_Rhmol06G0130500 [Rhododendron molle]